MTSLALFTIAAILFAKFWPDLARRIAKTAGAIAGAAIVLVPLLFTARAIHEQRRTAKKTAAPPEAVERLCAVSDRAESSRQLGLGR